jgi:hypothetical protein
MNTKHASALVKFIYGTFWMCGRCSERSVVEQLTIMPGVPCIMTILQHTVLMLVKYILLAVNFTTDLCLVTVTRFTQGLCYIKHSNIFRLLCNHLMVDISVSRCGTLSVIYFFTVNTHNNQAIYITLIPLPVSSVYTHHREGYVQFKTSLHKMT